VRNAWWKHFQRQSPHLEDGLKAAFVDIGFEKNAFLHYWISCPAPSTAAWNWLIGRTQRDNPASPRRIFPLYPPGGTIVQVTKGPSATKAPRATNLVLPGRYLVLLPTPTKADLAQDRKPGRTHL